MSGQRGVRRTRLITALALLAGITSPAAAQAQGSGEDKALGRTATASSYQETSVFAESCAPCLPPKAVDGDETTRWGSAFADPRPFFQVDLGSPRTVETVRVNWERSFATRYVISTSLDGSTFTDVATVENPDGGEVVTSFPAGTTRFVRLTALARSRAQFGVSMWDFQVFGAADPPPPAAATPPAASGSPRAPAPAPSAAPPTPAAAPLPLLGPFPIVRVRGTLTRRGVSIQLLSVRAPVGARIEVRCLGQRRGCPARRLVTRSRGFTRLRRLQRRLSAGAAVEVRVTAPGRVGKYTRFAIRRGRAPIRTDACVAFGASRPTPCPAS